MMTDDEKKALGVEVIDHARAIELIQAHKNRTLEKWNGIQWVPAVDTLRFIMESIPWNGSHFYRIRPTPKTRLIRVEELPAVMWVFQERDFTWELVYGIGPSCDPTRLHTKWHSFTIKEAQERHIQWSPDRKDVRSFLVEDTEGE